MSTNPDSTSSKKESFPEQFHRYFTQELSTLKTNVAGIKETPSSGRKDALDSNAARIEKLAKDVREASSSGAASFSASGQFSGGGKIPARDQRTYLVAVKQVMDELRSTRLELARGGAVPVPGFTPSVVPFTETTAVVVQKEANKDDKKQQQQQQPEDASVVVINSNLRESNGSIQEVDFSSSSSLTLTQHTSVRVRISKVPTMERYSALVNNISSSFVDMSSPDHRPTNLTLKSISSSILLCGRIDGPAHITGLTNVVLAIKCKQFRMHECVNVKIYLSSGSRPVVEDVKNVEFAPLPASFIQDEETGSNMWDKVQDFKWVKLGPSPNWRIMPIDTRLDENTWESLKGEDVDISNTLKRQGLET